MRRPGRRPLATIALVPRTPARSESSRPRLLPLLVLLRAGLVVGRRLEDLSERDRTRLMHLLRDSRGWPWSLGARDRRELGRLMVKLDPAALGRDLLGLIDSARRAGGRR